MKCKSRFLFLLLSASASFAFAEPHSQVGTVSGAIFDYSVTPRLVGMAGAGAALADDVNTLQLNPAGLGELYYPEVLLNHQSLYESVNHDQLALVIPLTGASAANLNNFGTIGFTAATLDYGNVQGRDNLGNPTSQFDGRESLFSVAYGKNVFQKFSVGATVKHYSMSLAGASDNVFLVDLGARHQVPGSPWGVGLLFQNVGTAQIQLESQSSRLPESFIAGASFAAIPDRVLIAADFVDPKQDNAGLRGGVEVWPSSLFGVRAGYNSVVDAGSGFYAGASIQIRKLEAWFFPVRRFRLDYALSFANEDSDALQGTQHIALSFQFGEDRDVP